MAKRPSDTVHIDRTPAHHKLQPGDWWQFIGNGVLYRPAQDDCADDTTPHQVGDVLIWQFKDEPFKRQFRVLAIPVEGVYECAYISRC